MQTCNLTPENYFDIGKLLLAAITVVLSYIELQHYKRKESNKLLSQLNKRYLMNDDMQAVVKYTDASGSS